jgi:hypothetical protein
MPRTIGADEPPEVEKIRRRDEVARDVTFAS